MSENFNYEIVFNDNDIYKINNFTDSFEYINDTFENNAEMLKLNAKSYFHFTANRHFSFSKIQYSILIYIINGGVSLACNEHLFSLDKYSLALISPDTAFKFYTPSMDAAGFLFILSGNQANFYLNKLNFNEIYIQKAIPSSYIGELCEKIYKHSEKDNELSMIYHSNRLNDIFYELCKLSVADNDNNEDSHIPAYIKSIKNSFDTEYYKDYSLDELEEIYNKNKYRISREFSAAYDISPFRYLNKVRINEAKKLLLNSDLNVRETGYEVGIKNTNHFINLFKRETGTTPLLFRKDAPDFLKND